MTDATTNQIESRPPMAEAALRAFDAGILAAVSLYRSSDDITAARKDITRARQALEEALNAIPVPTGIPTSFEPRSFSITKAQDERRTWALVVPNGQELGPLHHDVARFMRDACNAALRSRQPWIDDGVVAKCVPRELAPLWNDGKENAAILIRFARNVEANVSAVAAVVVAWSRGQISEGRACELTGLSRDALRQMVMKMVTDVTQAGTDMPTLLAKRGTASMALGRYVTQFMSELEIVCEGDATHTPTEFEQYVIGEAIHSMHADPEFWNRVDAWRALIPPTDAVPFDQESIDAFAAASPSAEQLASDRDAYRETGQPGPTIAAPPEPPPRTPGVVGGAPDAPVEAP
jgi:hypothetical protein